jgi:hypothetical protein
MPGPGAGDSSTTRKEGFGRADAEDSDRAGRGGAARVRRRAGQGREGVEARWGAGVTSRAGRAGASAMAGEPGRAEVGTGLRPGGRATAPRAPGPGPCVAPRGRARGRGGRGVYREGRGRCRGGLFRSAVGWGGRGKRATWGRRRARGGREERESGRRFWVRGRLTSGPHRGGWRRRLNRPRRARARGAAGPPDGPKAGEGGGWATEPAHEGRGAADVAGPRAWLGHAPGWAARGEVGKRKKRKGFLF